MAASTEQKVDFLLKKLGYSSSKTGIAEDESSLSGTKKAPFAEPIPSPLVVPDSSVWSNSENIPTTPPGSDTTYIKVYPASGSGWHMTEDTTVSGSRAFVARSTYNDNSTANLKNWIDTQFGPDYVVKVYKGDPNSGGVELAAAGSGSNDTWFFDYSSGVLNFNGTQIPSGVTATNVYIVGYRYIGETGVLTPGDDVSFRNLSVTGVSTLTGDVTAQNNLTVVGNLTVNGDNTILNTSSLEVEDRNIGIASAASKLSDAQIDGAGITIYSANGDKTLTWDNSNSRMAFSHDLFAPNLNVSGNLNVTGDVVYDEVTGRNINISGVGTITHLNLTSLSVSTGSTFTGNIDANGNLDVDGHTELDDVSVGSALTVTGNIDANRDVDIAGNVLVGGALTVTGTTTFNGGTLTLGDADTDNVVFGGDVDSNVIPDDDNTFDLGTSAKRWKDVYATNFHGDGSNLTNTGASLSAATGTQRLVVTNLTSGTMTTAATDSDLVFIAPHNLLSLNGNLSVTGVATFTGPITAGSSLGADGQYMRRTGTGVTWASFPKIRETVKFTATAGQTSFTWTHNVDFLDVFLNGVKLASTEYSNNGTSVTLDSGCFAGDIVEFHSWNVASNYGSGGGGSSTLNGLTDVTISGASNGQVLKYNGSAWVNDTDATGGGSVGTAGTWSSTATGISTTKNVAIGGNLNVTGISTFTGIGTFGNDLYVGGNLSVLGSTNLDSQTVNVDNLNVGGATTIAGVTTYTNHVHFGGNDKDVTFWAQAPEHYMKWDSLSNGFLRFTPNTHIFLGGTRSQIDPHGTGAAGHLRLEQYMDEGDNPFNIHSDFTGIKGSPTGGHESRDIAKFEYVEGTRLYHTGTKRLHTSGVGVTVYGELDATSATFSGNVSIAGTLTYEDVTHVDSLGISTFNEGIHVSGIVTAKAGAAVTYYGDGQYLTGIAAGSLDDGVDINPRHINASGISTFYGSKVHLKDNTLLTFGDTNDLQISHNGSDSIIKDAGVGRLKILGGFQVKNVGDTQTLITANTSGANATNVELYHSNVKRLETTGIGVSINQTLGISTVSGNWGANAGVGKTIDSFDVATDDFKTAEYTLWFNYSSGGVSNIQSQKLLVMQDGTTPYSQEFAIMSSPNKIVSVGASMTGTIVNINATPESGISGVTTYKLARNTLL